MFATSKPLSWAAGVAIALGLCSVAIPEGMEAQVTYEPPAIGNVTHHIRSISPHTGPAGTEVRIRADGLPRNTAYQVAIGEIQGCGYQVCTPWPSQTNGRGELTATLKVPDWAHTNHYEVIILMDNDFMPVAVSDPFHVSDADGFVQRQGVIGVAWPGCASLIGDHGLTYALVGPKARTLLASQGHEMIIEGRIVENVCAQAFGIEVEAMELAPGGG